MLLWHRGDDAESIVVLQRAASLYGAQSDITAQFGQMATQLFLAVVQADSGRFDDAEATFQRLRTLIETLIAEQPALGGLRAVYLRRYGVHHLRQGHYEQAERALLEGIEPSSPSATLHELRVQARSCLRPPPEPAAIEPDSATAAPNQLPQHQCRDSTVHNPESDWGPRKDQLLTNSTATAHPLYPGCRECGSNTGKVSSLTVS